MYTYIKSKYSALWHCAIPLNHVKAPKQAQANTFPQNLIRQATESTSVQSQDGEPEIHQQNRRDQKGPESEDFAIFCYISATLQSPKVNLGKHFSTKNWCHQFVLQQKSGRHFPSQKLMRQRDKPMNKIKWRHGFEGEGTSNMDEDIMRDAYR